MRVAFVTGATGLLGNNLVRLLVDKGWNVKVLVRSLSKANEQFKDLAGAPIEIVQGDMQAASALRPALAGVDVVFHTAAYFRDSYKGGSHKEQLHKVNVLGTKALLEAAHAAGVRRFVHTSSIAVLGHRPGGLVDEEDLQQDKQRVDDYHRSKIETDEVVYDFLLAHPDMHLSLVLPGWMHGPGDAGPTSAGQFVLDYMRGRLPGILDAAIAMVDARDVAAVLLAAAERGKAGRRYLAAGHAMHMRDIFEAMERVSGKAAPKRPLPTWLLFALASVQEAYARITGKPVLLSLATARNVVSDYGRAFSSARIRQEFGLGFRPIEDTLRDEIGWFRAKGQIA